MFVVVVVVAAGQTCKYTWTAIHLTLLVALAKLSKAPPATPNETKNSGQSSGNDDDDQKLSLLHVVGGRLVDVASQPASSAVVVVDVVNQSATVQVASCLPFACRCVCVCVCVDESLC